MGIIMGIAFLILIGFAMLIFGAFFSVVRSLSRWNKTYQRLGKRYAGKQANGGVFYGFLLSNPGLAFDYGRTYCYLRNRKTTRFDEGRQTEISMNWPNKKLKLEVSTSPKRSRKFGSLSIKNVAINDSDFGNKFYVSSNTPAQAEKLLSQGVQWQLEQLRRHTGETDLIVTIHGGKLAICKPGYLKGYQVLDDYIRFSLELFDQLMLVGAEGIEFKNENTVAIVDDVKCPICSEEIQQDLVVCTRCKTPHCLDCWQYNGQCATFACGEKRYLKEGSMHV